MKRIALAVVVLAVAAVSSYASQQMVEVEFDNNSGQALNFNIIFTPGPMMFGESGSLSGNGVWSGAAFTDNAKPQTFAPQLVIVGVGPLKLLPCSVPVGPLPRPNGNTPWVVASVSKVGANYQAVCTVKS